MKTEHWAGLLFAGMGLLVLAGAVPEFREAWACRAGPQTVAVERLEDGRPPSRWLTIEGHVPGQAPIFEGAGTYTYAYYPLLSERRARERPAGPVVFSEYLPPRTNPSFPKSAPPTVTGLLRRQISEDDKTMLRRRFPDIDPERLVLLKQDETPTSLRTASIWLAIGLGLLAAGGTIAAKARKTAGRSKLAGWILRVTAPMLGVGGVFLLYTAFVMFKNDQGMGFVAFFTALGAAMLTGWVYMPKRARQHLAVSAAELEAQDPRPPVLYLRSFAADQVTARATEFLDKTEEELVADVLGEFGPVVAIGKPGEELPELGAARLYVGDPEWKATVAGYMERGTLTVLRLGSTMGFWWELERSATKLDPTKLVLLTPYDREPYELFVAKGQAHFQKGLPEFEPSDLAATDPTFGSLRAIVYFRPDWTPVYVDLSRASWGWEHFLNFFTRQKLWSRLKWALRPVYVQRAVAWRAPRVRWLLLGAIDFMACAFAFSVPTASYLTKPGEDWSLLFLPLLGGSLLVTGTALLVFVAVAARARRKLDAAPV